MEIIDGGGSKMHDNGGSGFPLSDGIIPLESGSCHSHFGDLPDTEIVIMVAVCLALIILFFLSRPI